MTKLGYNVNAKITVENILFMKINALLDMEDFSSQTVYRYVCTNSTSSIRNWKQYRHIDESRKASHFDIKEVCMAIMLHLYSLIGTKNTTCN